MKPWPDPMAAHSKLIAAVCDDLFHNAVNKTEGTPRADRVAEINRQYRGVKS